MKKIVIGIIGIGIVVTVIGFLVLYNIGSIIERAIHRYGPEYTRTEVTVDDVDVALMAGSAELRNFFVGNPDGFDSRTAIQAESVKMDINEKTVRDNPLVIESIRMVAPEVHYEMSGRTDNLRTILNNIRQAAGAEKAPPKPEDERGPRRKFVIKDFTMTGGVVTLALTGMQDRTIRAQLPPIHLENIGGQGGTVPAEAVAIILDQVYKVIRSAEVRNLLNRELRKLGLSLETLRINPDKPTESLRRGTEDAIRGKMKELLEK